MAVRAGQEGKPERSRAEIQRVLERHGPAADQVITAVADLARSLSTLTGGGSPSPPVGTLAGVTDPTARLWSTTADADSSDVDQP
jgi:hypothetical protein